MKWWANWNCGWWNPKSLLTIWICLAISVRFLHSAEVNCRQAAGHLRPCQYFSLNFVCLHLSHSAYGFLHVITVVPVYRERKGVSSSYQHVELIFTTNLSFVSLFFSFIHWLSSLWYQCWTYYKISAYKYWARAWCLQDQRHQVLRIKKDGW